MTQRKPTGVSFESWIDGQIREATERGDFDDLPGAGKPLAGYGERYEAEWWLRDYLRREGDPVDELLPTPLRLRKRIHRLPDTVRPLRTEQAVLDAVAEVNDEVRAWWRSSVGPAIHIGLADADAIVARWRADRAAAVPETASVDTESARPRRIRWWHRRTTRGN